MTTAVLAQREPAEWAYLMPLLPLALLMATGLYIFVLPYVFVLPYLARRRSSAEGSGEG